MHFYGWAILITIFIVVGFELRRRRTLRQINEELSALGVEAQEEPRGFATQIANSLRHRLQAMATNSGPRQDLPDAFYQWASESLADDQEIQTWLMSLSPAQVGAFVSHLQKFCKDMGFDIGWLVHGDLTDNPILGKSLANIVRQYSRISYEAVGLHEDVEGFRVYHQYLQNPNSRDNRLLAQAIFGRLVEKGLTADGLAKYLTSSGQLPPQRVDETIREVSSTNPAGFHEAVKSILAEQNGHVAPSVDDLAKTSTHQKQRNGSGTSAKERVAA
ncbi:MAG: hypothetical protein AAF702_01865 [Chloroflexota bacterium]